MPFPLIVPSIIKQHSQLGHIYQFTEPMNAQTITPPQIVNIQEKLSGFPDHWSPKIIAQMNDIQFKLVKVQGDFVWHSHDDTDEVFYILEGELRIDFRDGPITLTAGEMTVIPKGVEHKPYAENECHIMLVEPTGVINTGDASDAAGDLTAEDEWI